MTGYSSLFNISGDGPVSITKAIFYVAVNVLNNTRPFFSTSNRADWSESYSVQSHILTSFHDFWNNNEELEACPSPSRALSNFFWMALPWKKIRLALGGKIHLLDMGCGTGKYFQLLQNWGGHTLDTYHGIDSKKSQHWAQISKNNPDVRFKVMESLFSEDDLKPDTNFIMTQSSIEHFEFDSLFFIELRKFLDHSPKPFIQVHLLPSAACLWLYLTHGYRQYTPFTIDKMTDSFSQTDTKRILLPLGGRHCNFLHFSAITLSKLTRRLRSDQRQTAPGRYRQKLKKAILRDLERPKGSPSFYAVVLLSNMGSQIL